MSSVIKVENLSKSYFIGHQRQERYTALRDILTNSAKGFLKNAANMFKGQQLMGNDSIEEFFALKDINFEINQGDRVGIIGRNGAGKSTLLKILSRITEPTSGRVTINGRVASLLEVGTGFHPELTGRENIYLNGAILGMSRNDIKRKFDEIVAFAEVEKFLDTPVKRYSSGMYVRLAFAVAAHLEPEILIVDEVLAVGDAEFQKKCLGKMEDVSKNEGRSVIFVSHNMAAVKSLCTRGILLENGRVKLSTTIENAVASYLSGASEVMNKISFSEKYRNKDFTLHEISLNPAGKSSDVALDEYQVIELNTILSIHNENSNLHLTYVLNNEYGEPLFTFSHINCGMNLLKGINRVKCVFPKGFLNIGTYYLEIYIIKDKKRTIFFEKDIVVFSVQEGQRPLGAWLGKEPGFIKPTFDWSIGK